MMVSVRTPVIGWARGWTRRTEERGKGNSVVLTNDLLGSARRSYPSWATSTYMSMLVLATVLEHKEDSFRKHQ